MGLSLAERVARLPVEQRQAWIEAQPPHVLEEMARGEWWWVARPEQIPPPGDWLVHLALAGRGWGKSRAGAEWIVEQTQLHPFDRHGAPTEWLVIAETLSDSRTICMEGPAGILRVLDRRKIKHRYKQSPRPMVIFPDKTKIYCEGADDADVGRGYNAAGGWLDEICVAAGELVLTFRGQIPIEDVCVGDRVWTRSGWRPVSVARKTGDMVPVVDVLTRNGSIRVTPDHRVWTTRGWIQAQDLVPGDTLLTCPPQMESKTRYPRTLQPSTNGTGKLGSTTSAPATTTTVTGCCSIVPSGQKPLDRFRMVMRFTTGTGTGLTADSPTWNFSQSRSTAVSLRENVTIVHGWREDRSAPAKGSPTTGLTVSPEMLSATSVERLTKAPVCELSDAPRNVARSMPGTTRETAVIAVLPAGNADVYDITVEGMPEFFAGNGGLLVHNCKWSYSYDSWYQGIMPSLRADLRDDHPRVFATTTPKPIKLLQEWVKRQDGTVSIVSGSTFDNRANLSSLVLRELLTRYEGTTIGRQELYGELLEAIEGALFKRSDINRARIAELPEKITSIVVGVDPGLTDDGDEMGVVVVGRNNRTNELYVLADRSVTGAGREAARHVWRVAAEFGADWVVVETNLGKRWMTDVFEDAYRELTEDGLFPENTTPPVKTVDAKVGKMTRAQPVAMRYEQGRVHHLGLFPELEDEMVVYTGEERESPNRMDALVHACRWLMQQEKRTMRFASPVAIDSQFESLTRGLALT